MKKVCFMTIYILACALTALPQEIVEKRDNVKIKKTFQLETAYIYAEEELLISVSDNNCTFFIRQDPLPVEYRIIASPGVENAQSQYGTFDTLYIDAGANEGLKEGEQLMVLARGDRFRSPISKRKLGNYYLKKSLATITCIYEDRSVITLDDTCNSVEVGDLVIPYTPENTLWEKKLNYTLCRIPENALEGIVSYQDIFMGAVREITGPGNYVGLELGEGILEKGTFILFYRKIREDLPHMIVGLGIVIHCEKEVCTVKVLEATKDIRIGDHGVVLMRTNEVKEVEPEPEVPVAEKTDEETKTDHGRETEAIVDSPEDRMMSDLLFDFNSKTIPTEAMTEIEKAIEFARANSDYLIILRGYSCSIGGEEYNLKLSQERVEAVKNLLLSQYNIDPAKIETYYYGEKESLFDNSQEAERKKNRLVKIEVIGK